MFIIRILSGIVNGLQILTKDGYSVISKSLEETVTQMAAAARPLATTVTSMVNISVVLAPIAMFAVETMKRSVVDLGKSLTLTTSTHGLSSLASQLEEDHKIE